VFSRLRKASTRFHGKKGVLISELLRSVNEGGGEVENQREVEVKPFGGVP
jgi:hypothetical protein